MFSYLIYFRIANLIKSVSVSVLFFIIFVSVSVSVSVLFLIIFLQMYRRISLSNKYFRAGVSRTKEYHLAKTMMVLVKQNEKTLWFLLFFHLSYNSVASQRRKIVTANVNAGLILKVISQIIHLFDI